jgi:methionyl-tRNA synthetase
LGLAPLTKWDEIGVESSLPEGTRLGQPVPMFPRLEARPAAGGGQNVAPKSPKEKKMVEEKKDEQIEFADFMKVQLRVARIIEAEPVEGSDKLMKLQVKIGDERRQILAGIKQKYGAEDLIGRQVVVVTNLKPRKMMGMESQGMVLAADDADGQAILLEPDKEAPEGTSVH